MPRIYLDLGALKFSGDCLHSCIPWWNYSNSNWTRMPAQQTAATGQLEDCPETSAKKSLCAL